ncbi:hypothetical protein M947_06935 [Sulfurimonas hongkongensis]|uniref:Uncharacterized protein n=1 Tax=Sulfurimonas hongkongensis TaxID=1172190 RepID=T0L0T6_9BACT|nr:hypothetical protein [Sulfurimonas hongkongensis]EQB39388.1 hypothetical protein M947_06935 [Sulfurimonas hongkongensis]
MNWFNFFDTKITELRHPFGRGINASLSPNEEELFNKSYESFEKHEILDAYEFFLKTLENFTNQISNKNITIIRDDEKLEFEIFQGSARVTGVVTKESLYAQVVMIKTKEATVALKRYILERNYQLTYANYSSDGEFIKLKLYHDNITASPQKIFFPLREIALNADFDKEYLKSEFKDIRLEDSSHIVKLEDDELKIKYEFLHKWIDELEAKILTLPTNDNAGMQAFLYLHLLFKIDYLLIIKCDVYQKMSKKIRIYFSDENLSTEYKNEELRKYVEKLKNMDFKEFSKKFYSAKYTFNPMEKVSHEEISNFIDESFIKIRWYKNNRYNQIIPTIYRYIPFYILYNYGLNPIVKRLLHTLVKIQNPTFFKALGYSVLYDKDKKIFAKKAIKARINDTIVPHQARYKELKPFGDKLNFSSLNEFSNSYLLQLKHLNFEEI